MNQNNLPNTMFENAFDYVSSIKPKQTTSIFSEICIYCNHPESKLLMQDGSFRLCLRCNKQFKSQIKPREKETVSQNVIYRQETFQSMRPNILPIIKKE